MGKKDNMKQAMYEMFGVGSGASESADPKPSAPAARTEKEPEKKAAAPTVAERPVEKPAAEASYLARGTAFEGTFRSAGDVEIAGEFKGDLITEGTVLLHSNIQSNITAGSLNLAQCALVGNVTVSETVTVSQGSKISGNVTAKELLCAGEITGDLNVSGNTALEEKARINGSVTTGTMAMVKGAVIKGSIEMKNGAAV